LADVPKAAIILAAKLLLSRGEHLVDLACELHIEGTRRFLVKVPNFNPEETRRQADSSTHLAVARVALQFGDYSAHLAEILADR
jgi:hypothetical protein